ncbi:MAG: hypothetical protein ACREYE_25935 [Gammaproteobacteria bacterium]
MLWQETYDRDRYSLYHGDSLVKKHYDERYMAYERMLRAGVRHIGMGVLSGLAPWREDWAQLIRHEEYLFQEYGVRPAILGTPRVKTAAGAIVADTRYQPTDEEFTFAIAVHTLFAPEAVPWVNTREPWDLCVTLAQGGSLFTFDCSTTPGGYTQQIKSYQFPTYSYPVPTFGQKLEKKGLRVAMQWTFDESGGIKESHVAGNCSAASTLTN